MEDYFIEDYSDLCDYEYLKKQITNIITHDDWSAEKMVDMIGELIGIEV